MHRGLREGRLRIEEVPAGICCVDLEGRFIQANRRYCEMSGYDLEELRRMTAMELIHPDDRERDLAALRRMLAGERLEGAREQRLVRQDGSVLWVDLAASLLRDERGRPVGAVGVVRDATQRRQSEAALKDSERRFRTLFEQAPISVQLLAPDGRTLEVNAAWIELWQAPRETVEGYLLKEYNILKDPQLEAKGIAPYFREAFAGHSVVVPPLLYDPAEIGQPGRPRWTVAHVHPIKDEGGIVRELMLIHRDVTEQIETETQLRRAKEAAEAASRAKSAFLANMSHEIRTPLAAIMGFTHLLKDHALSPEERDEYLGIIERNGDALTHLIDDLLDLSRVEAGSLSITRRQVRLRDAIEDVLGLLLVEATRKSLCLSLRIEAEAPEWAVTDPVRLRQILVNLVGNAVRFTAVGGVEVTLGAAGPGTVAISIRDTGPGIPPERHDQLFRPFSQIDDTTTREFGGTGLGLALSRRLARALGGDVVLADSAAGKGSTFVVSLRAGEAEATGGAAGHAGSEAPPEGTSGELAGTHVLIVEDSADMRHLLARLLRRRGALVEVAPDGRQAIERATAENPDVILMDIQMPGMDGYEVTRELRRRGYRKPIIAVTAHAMNEERQKVLDAGCNAHVSKPLKVARLAQLIREHACTSPPFIPPRKRGGREGGDSAAA